MSKTFCIKPWTHACVRTNGNITFCCQSTESPVHNLKNSAIDDWWTSDMVNTVRAEMLAEREPSMCRECYDQERKGFPSLRQKSNKEYKIFEAYAPKYLTHFNYPRSTPIDYEFQLTNLCNLKCLMCDEIASSAIATENKKLNISRVKNEDFAVTNEEVSRLRQIILNNPEKINFRGGEPLLIPEIKNLLLWALDQDLLSDTQVHITTNGTKLTPEWLEILHKIPKLRVMLSVDAVGDLYEYMRHGAKWDKVEAHAKILSEIPGIDFLVFGVLQNINVLKFHELEHWCKKNGYYLMVENIADPDIFSIGNFPEKLLDMVNFSKSVKPLNNTELWGKFVKEINTRDKLRKVSILDVIPELEPFWVSDN